MNRKISGIGAWVIVMLVLALMFRLFAAGVQTKEEITYSELVNAMDNNEVVSLVIKNNGSAEAVIKADDGNTREVTASIPSLRVLQEDIDGRLSDTNTEIQYSSIDWMSLASIFLPVILILVMFFVFFRKGGAGAGNAFTKNHAKMSSDSNVKFDDVAGADEEKAELAELVEFLKNPKKFTDLGARIPKGVLLVGSPGTGKTLLAKAVAGEAGVPFFSISGSDFVELYVGVGASRVRDLFEQAKKNRPCIIFIDEIDAVGRKRGAGIGGGHDEREQTLNQLLVEMDGFGVNEGVIMIAATNRPDILDPALLRPGRFDRQVVVDLPDVNGREGILRVHSRKKPLSNEVDLNKIAKATAGYSGADLENLMNEAAIFAARRNHESITERDIEDANVKVMIGAEKKSRVMSDKEKKLTAYHEAGHAILTKLVDKSARIHQVSIIPRGRAGGYTMHISDEDKTYMSKSEMLNDIIIFLGGRVAESLTMDDISTGASNDIQRATRMAREMVAKYGMSENIGPVSYDDGAEVFIGQDFGHSKSYSDQTAADIDKEVKRIMQEQYAETERLLKENADLLNAVASLLLEKETIDEDEFNACFESINGVTDIDAESKLM